MKFKELREPPEPDGRELLKGHNRQHSGQIYITGQNIQN